MMSMRRQWVRWQALVLLGLVVLGGSRVLAEDAVEARMRKDIFYLASDECEGRGVSTKGINLAADYIANEFKKAGLKPAGPDGSYFQPFTMNGPAKMGSPNTVALRGPAGQQIELERDQQFRPFGIPYAGKVTAPVVFAGYGITSKGAGHDDYKDLDVEGKIVVILRKTPRMDNRYTPFDNERRDQHAALVTKLENAEKHKAALVLFVNDRDTARGSDALMTLAYSSGAAGRAKVPAVHVRREVVDAMLQSS